jgi:hypothetical protein
MSSPNTDDNTTRSQGRQTSGSTPSHHGPDSTPSNQLGNAECPSFAEDVERTVCWPTDDTSAEAIYLTASSTTFEPSPGGGLVEHIKFTLHNDSSQTFGLNPHAWAIKRQTTNGWEHVAPEVTPEPWLGLKSGESYTWRLRIERHGGAEQNRMMAIAQNLADGTYAFQITGELGGESGESKRIECIAQFKVRR